MLRVIGIMKKTGLILSLWLSATCGMCLPQGAAAEVQIITDGKSLYLSCEQALIALEQGLEQLPADKQNDAFVCMAYIGGVLATAQHANDLAKLRFALASGGQGESGDFHLYCFNWQRSVFTTY